jgi:hypothetical protein
MTRETLLIAVLTAPLWSAVSDAQPMANSAAVSATAVATAVAPATSPADPPASQSHCVDITQQSRPPLYADSLGIVFGRDVPRKLVERAVEQWKRCPGYGTDFPRLLVGEPGTQTVEVSFDRAYRGGRRCGGFQGREITLYAFAVDEDGRSQFCGSRSDGLAHELGHALGLLDAPMETGCRDHAMAVIDSANRDRRQIQLEECLAVGRRWLTPYEVPMEAGSEPVRLASSGIPGF